MERILKDKDYKNLAKLIKTAVDSSYTLHVYKKRGDKKHYIIHHNKILYSFLGREIHKSRLKNSEEGCKIDYKERLRAEFLGVKKEKFGDLSSSSMSLGDALLMELLFDNPKFVVYSYFYNFVKKYNLTYETTENEWLFYIQAVLYRCGDHCKDSKTSEYSGYFDNSKNDIEYNEVSGHGHNEMIEKGYYTDGFYKNGFKRPYPYVLTKMLGEESEPTDKELAQIERNLSIMEDFN